jgi:Fur family ferric uptake transcriptional regulator
MAAMASTPAHHRLPHEHHDTEARVEAVLDALRAEGGRTTTGRRAIVTALLTGPDHHVTAEELAASVQAEHPDVHLSTVYRTLDALEHAGIVQRVVLGPGGAVYHLTDHAHHHLVCESCGSVQEVPAGVVGRLARDVRVTYGFELSTSHLSLAGRCRACVSEGSAVRQA